MNPNSSYRVFVSYTGQDLETHAEVVSDMIKRLNADTNRNWVAIDHKYWSPTGRPSVMECMEQVERCQILIILVAFRYGWVPAPQEGGDGESSITRLEVERARARGLQVLPFLVVDDANWKIADVEGYGDPASRAPERLNRFKAELRGSLAGFFETPKSLEAQVVLALNKAADRIESTPAPARAPTRRIVGGGDSDQVIPAFYDPAHPPTLEQRLETRLPKRILSLDSGGVRTAILFGYLERLEQLLRARYGDADFRLSDYFDLIGASGVSAIIAAELVRGCSVAEARATFLDAMRALLGSKSLFMMTTQGTLYRPAPLLGVLQARFGGMTLASSELGTGLGIVLSRVDTGELLSLTNHPKLRTSTHDGFALAQLLLASMSTPAVLPPVKLPLGSDSAFALSGELSVGPDPALHLFLVATSPAFPFGWRPGRRRIFLLSIGAGSPPVVKREPGSSAISSIAPMISSMLSGLKQQSDLALAALTHEDVVDAPPDTGDAGTSGARPSVLHYRRFDVALDAAKLRALALVDRDVDQAAVVSMDRADQIETHLQIGQRAARRDMQDDLFSASFDVRPLPGRGVA